ncbi:hypothetical protein ONZ45_g4828 [Pleurotus djamor]|nr:hypothetical protein ONZ45_g4828 [Pleurotus djamor]
MARTKQTASKSVDGTAPRKAPSTTSLADTASKVQKTKAVTGRKQALQKASVRPYMLAAPKEGKKDSLCTGCQNGGEVICCDTCNGWLCYVVVQPRDDGLFVEDPAANGCLQVTSQKQAEELEFICPRCHCDKDAAFSTKTRYFGFLDKEKKPVEGVLVAVRRAGSIFFAPIKTPNTVLLFLALEGCETMDQPMIDAHSYLEPYFGRDGGVLKTFSVFFNFQKSGVDGYKRQLRDVVDAVSDAATSQVVVIFMTHIGEGGCLQHSPVVMNNKDEVIDEGGSFDPKELLPQLFVNELTQPLKDKLRSTLMFFVCGGIEGHTETRDWMLESVSNQFSCRIPSVSSRLLSTFMSHIRNVSSYYRKEDIAAFLKCAMLGNGDAAMPAHWRGLRVEQLASDLATAFENRVVLPVTAARLTQATTGKRTRMLDGIELGDVTQPMLVLSSDGIPLIVYLPSLLSSQTQMDFAQSVSTISSILMKPLTDKKRSQRWRTAPKHFARPVRGLSVVGAETFSPGWYTRFSKRVGPPKPSISLRRKRNIGQATSWLKQLRGLFTVGDVLLSLFHPQSYVHGQRTINTLKTSDDASTAYWANHWPSVFSCLSALANRRSPLHLDGKGDSKQFDALFNTGTAKTVIRLRQLGAIFAYPPGASMMFSGRVFEHDSPGWFEGERVGFVLHMRPEVQQFLDVEAYVDLSDEDEDMNDAENDFLEDDDHNDVPRPHPPSATSLDADAEHAANEAAATAIRLRHHHMIPRAAESTFVDEEASDTGLEESLRLMPSISDPDLWQVDVQEGKEVETVGLIFSQALERDIPIQSAFQRDHIPGVVYIEGPYGECVRAIENLSTIRLRRRQMKSLIQIVDVAHRSGLLHSAQGPCVHPYSLVRIRNRSINRNDIGYVNAVDGAMAEVYSTYRTKKAPLRPGLAMRDVPADEDFVHGAAQPRTLRRRFIEGLRIQRIPVHLLQTTFINPTATELDLLSKSPLFDPKLLVEGDGCAQADTWEQSRRFTHAIIQSRKSLNVLNVGDKVVVTSGVFAGSRGTINETALGLFVLEINLGVQLPSLEVPLRDLTSSTQPTPGTHVYVRVGPYKGLNGLVESVIDDDHVVFQPFAERTQLCEVPSRSVTRDFQLGDHINVVLGTHAGTQGFVVKNDLWQVDLFVKESMSMITVATDSAVPASPEVPLGDGTSQPTPRQYSGPERFKHLESGTHTLRNVRPKDMTKISASKFGLEIISLIILPRSDHQSFKSFAALLPRSIIDPPKFAPGTKRARTPDGAEELDVDDYVWRPGRDELSTHTTSHWLLKVPIDSKVKVVIQGTTEADINGVHREAYRGGRYEDMHGTVVITSPLKDDRSSVNVRDVSLFVVAARVVVIGPDLSGDSCHEGKYGIISACAYPLPAGQRLLFIEPAQWAYFDIRSLCFSGDMVEWQGRYH